MEILNQTHYILGEGPVWLDEAKRFYWVDIFDNKILSVSSGFNDLNIIEMPDKIGCVVPTRDGNVLAALSKQIIKIDLHSNKLSYLTDTNAISDREMFNDGKTDCMGRFWIATKDTQESDPVGNLYMFDGTELIKKASGFTVGNGLDWTLDNTKMYFTDSPAKNIYLYDFDKGSGDIKNQSLFASIDRGYPDGLTVDSLGQVWGAHWNGGCVTCYAPDGDIRERIEMPCEKPTSCAFGGEDLKTLMITSSTVETEIEGTQNGFVFFKSMDVPGRLPFLADI